MVRAPVRSFAAALLLAVSFAAQVEAQEGARWEQLGSKAVDFRGEKDVITVTAREGRFDAIKLVVSGNSIEVLDLKVRFGNGDVQDVQVREQIREGGETRVIDLERDDRVIQAIELVYRTQGRAREGRAEVKVFGRHSTRAAEDWVRLGEREVAFKGERDTIAVTGVEGRFSKVMLEVKLNGIEVRDLKLHYGDGETQDVEVRENIPANGRTRAIDLSGGSRVINRVELVYKTEDRRDGRATVVLWGLRAAGGNAEPARGGGNDAGPGLEREGWKPLGQREVTFRVERDTIEVGRDAGRFNKIRFVVRGNAVEILDVKVTFGNGDTQDVQVRERIAEGAATRVIDLGGEQRFIRTVEFVYRTDGPNREGRATIRLFGR